MKVRRGHPKSNNSWKRDLGINWFREWSCSLWRVSWFLLELKVMQMKVYYLLGSYLVWPVFMRLEIGTACKDRFSLMRFPSVFYSIFSSRGKSHHESHVSHYLEPKFLSIKAVPNKKIINGKRNVNYILERLRNLLFIISIHLWDLWYINLSPYKNRIIFIRK